MDRAFQSYHEDLKFHLERAEADRQLTKVTDSGRGWVFMGAHVGGWDLSALFFKRDARSKLGMVHFIGVGQMAPGAEGQGGEGSLITVKNFLAENKHVGFLADRAVGTQIELVPFLGKLAPFETRPFRVAAACRAPLIYTYMFKAGEKDYVFHALDKPDMKYSPDKDRRLQIYEWTREFVQDLEKQMRRHPYQWFNFYPFWSSLPKAVPGADIQLRQDNCLWEDLYLPPRNAAPEPKL
jgi:predicted LPLAT superfamily acyltransferase